MISWSAVCSSTHAPDCASARSLAATASADVIIIIIIIIMILSPY
jgi:hypothetical protein